MMLVRCRIGPSPLDGLGVRAEEPIAAAQPAWRLNPELDRLIVPAAISTLPGAQQEFLNRYAYLNPRPMRFQPQG